MNRETIKRLNGGAARLLLVLLTCEGTETLEDLPNLIELAGLSHTHNSHGKNRYARAFQQLLDLRLIEVQGRTICVLFEDLLFGLGNLHSLREEKVTLTGRVLQTSPTCIRKEIIVSEKFGDLYLKLVKNPSQRLSTLWLGKVLILEKGNAASTERLCLAYGEETEYADYLEELNVIAEAKFGINLQSIQWE